MISRRGLLGSLAVALAAPAIIRSPGLLMPVKPLQSDGVALFSVPHPKWQVGIDAASGVDMPITVFWMADSGIMTTVGGQTRPMMTDVLDAKEAREKMRLMGFSIPADAVSKKVGGYTLWQAKV